MLDSLFRRVPITYSGDTCRSFLGRPSNRLVRSLKYSQSSRCRSRLPQTGQRAFSLGTIPAGRNSRTRLSQSGQNRASPLQRRRERGVDRSRNRCFMTSAYSSGTVSFSLRAIPTHIPFGSMFFMTLDLNHGVLHRTRFSGIRRSAHHQIVPSRYGRTVRPTRTLLSLASRPSPIQ